jgi:hypothetical protein
MTEYVLLYAIGVLLAGALLAWMSSPWRSLLAWICMLSVQLPYKIGSLEMRPALSDVFLPSMALGLLLSRAKGSFQRSMRQGSLSSFVILFAASFLTVANAVTYFELGTVPQWTWLNKDIGLIDLVFSFFVVLHFVNSLEKLLYVVKVFVVSGSFINLLAVSAGIARYAFGISSPMMQDDADMRIIGLMVNPGSYGGFISCVFMMQLTLLLGRSNLLPFPWCMQQLNLLLLGMATVMTLSRSALLGLATGLLAILGFYGMKAGVRLVGLGLAMLVMMALLLSIYVASPDASSTFWRMELHAPSFLARIDANRAALKLFLSGSPLIVFTGIGVGTFLVRSQSYIGLPMIIHNDFVWLLVETGVSGVLLFTAIMYVSLRNCIAAVRAGSSYSAIAAGVACSLVATLGWMMGTEGLWHRHVWFLLALSEVCHRLCAKNRSVARQEIPRESLNAPPHLAVSSVSTQ